MAEVLNSNLANGCYQTIPNAAAGKVLGILPNGEPGYLDNPSGPSTDAANALRAGSDGLPYLSCEDMQDCIGLAIANGLGITYNDALNAISGALSIPITSGAGAPSNITNSPTIYTDTATGNVYYRDATGAIVLIEDQTLIHVTAGPDATTVTEGPYDLKKNDTLHFYGTTVKFSLINNSVDVGAEVAISATAGNLLTAQTDGLYVGNTAETPLTANDSTTIDFTTSGTSNHTLTASVILDAAGGLAVGASGLKLFLDPAATNLLSLSASGLKATFSETTFTANDSTTIDFTTSGTNGHTLTASVIVDPAGGLTIGASGLKLLLDPASTVTLSVGAAGLKATYTQTQLSVTDSSTVDLTASGTNNHTIQADVKVSATAGNQITTNADGLYVAASTLSETSLTVNDTTTVNLTAAGVSNHTLQADVKISATAGNQITTNADGLYVAAAATTSETSLTANDSSTIDFTTSGTSNHTLTASVITDSTGGLSATAAGLKIVLDPTSTVNLSLSAAGLKATFTETTLTVTDTSTVDLTAAGTNGHSIQAAVKISATAGNQIVTNADGLYVGASSFTETSMTANDSSTIDFTVSGTSNHTLTGTVKISTTAGNQITANADGLYVGSTAVTADNGLTLTGTNVQLGGTLIQPTTITGTATNTLTIDSGSTTGVKVFKVNGDMTVTGVIDPVEVQFSGTTQNGSAYQVRAIANNPLSLAPFVDRTSAVEIRKADLTTAILSADTLNARIGINTNAPGAALDVNGPAILRGIQLGNFAANGAIGTAAATVDIASTIRIQQITAGITLTLPLPTVTTNGRLLVVINNGTTSVTVDSQTIAAGQSSWYAWSGTGWFRHVVGSSGTDSTTASNGLTLSTADVQLGGTLTKNTTIAQAGFTLSLTNTGTQATGINMSNSAGNGYLDIETSGNVNLNASSRIQFLTNGTTRGEFLNAGTFLLEGPGTANTSGLRFANLSNTSPVTASSTALGVDASGNVVTMTPTVSTTSGIQGTGAASPNQIKENFDALPAAPATLVANTTFVMAADGSNPDGSQATKSEVATYLSSGKGNFTTDWGAANAAATYGTKIYVDANGELRGVPEHTSVTAHDSTTSTVAATTNPGTTVGATSPVVTMNNPSATRVMNTYWILTGVYNAFYADGTNADSQLYLSYNGGAFTSIASENKAIVGAAWRNDHRILVDSAFQIAAGGSITLQVKAQMSSYAGTLTFSSALAAASGIGVTT